MDLRFYAKKIGRYEQPIYYEEDFIKTNQNIEKEHIKHDTKKV